VIGPILVQLLHRNFITITVMKTLFNFPYSTSSSSGHPFLDVFKRNVYSVCCYFSRHYFRYYKLLVQVSSLQLLGPQVLMHFRIWIAPTPGLKISIMLQILIYLTRFYIMLFGQIPTKCVKVFRGITSHL
jgi:hypothetical protein